jgi:hypothetical protein
MINITNFLRLVISLSIVTGVISLEKKCGVDREYLTALIWQLEEIDLTEIYHKKCTVSEIDSSLVDHCKKSVSEIESIRVEMQSKNKNMLSLPDWIFAKSRANPCEKVMIDVKINDDYCQTTMDNLRNVELYNQIYWRVVARFAEVMVKSMENIKKTMKSFNDKRLDWDSFNLWKYDAFNSEAKSKFPPHDTIKGFVDDFFEAINKFLVEKGENPVKKFNLNLGINLGQALIDVYGIAIRKSRLVVDKVAYSKPIWHKASPKCSEVEPMVKSMFSFVYKSYGIKDDIDKLFMLDGKKIT